MVCLSRAEVRRAGLQLRREAKKHLVAKQWQLAADAAAAALALTPGSYKAHRLRALAHAGLSDHAAALRDVDAALRALPNCSDAWYQKGYAHFHLQHLRESVRPPLACFPSTSVICERSRPSLAGAAVELAPAAVCLAAPTGGSCRVRCAGGRLQAWPRAQPRGPHDAAGLLGRHVAAVAAARRRRGARRSVDGRQQCAAPWRGGRRRRQRNARAARRGGLLTWGLRALA